MEFLDSLILGSNTPRYADEALFPSRTYKKLICNRKHCNTTCASKTLAEFEFWAYFLSEKKPNRREVRKKIHTISKDLRFSIWAKCSGSRERHMELKPVGPHDPAKAPDTKDGVNDHGRLDDRDLVRFILDMCRSTEDCSQEAIFNILKNLERDFPIISNHELLVLFIMHVLELPYASPQTVYCLIYSLMKSHNFCSIFSESKKSDEPAEDNDTDGDIVNKADPGFWKALISEHSSVLDQIIDLLLCYEGADIASVPLFLREQTGGDNLEEWVRFMSMRSNLERLGSVFESNKLSGPVEVDRREETYFDFLVIQNEAIKAQETMRMEVSERLNSLQEERDELYAQKANLVEACSSLESDLKEYQEKYVKKVETMLHDAEDRCKKYERENTELKERLHENEYK